METPTTPSYQPIPTEPSATPVTPMPAPMAPPMPAVPTPKKSHKVLWSVGIAVVVLLAAYGAYAFYADMWPFAPAEDSAVEWKTYTNTQYGFEIKYPPQWTLSTEGIQSGGTAVSFDTGVYGDSAEITIEPRDAAGELSANQVQHGGFLFTFSGNHIDEIRPTFRFTGVTTGWKTFNSVTTGFSLRYPADMTTLEEVSPSGVVSIVLNGQDLRGFVIINNPGSGAPVAVAEPATKGTITVDGVAISYRTGHTQSMGSDSPGVALGWTGQFKALGNEYYFGFVSPSGTDRIELVRTILSTFKFTDVTVGWKTYTNTQHGFTLQLPPSWDDYRTGPTSFETSKGIKISSVYFATPCALGQGGFLIHFEISVWPIAEYERAKAEAVTDGSPFPSVEIQRNKVSVYTYTRPQDGCGDAGWLAADQDYPKVIATFKFTK